MTQRKTNTLAQLLAAVAVTLLALLLSSCARDVTGDVDEEPEPVLIRLGMRTQGNFSSDTWYYFVVNFSNFPSTTIDDAPFPSIATEERGRNWELYIMYHQDTVLGEQLVTLQRPRLPTQILTATEPVDAVAGNFTPGDSDTPAGVDIIVACRAADRLQLVKARELLLFENFYFEEAVTVDSLGGPAPFRVHSIDLDADSDLDLVVVYQGDETGGPQFRTYINDGLGAFAQQSVVDLPEAPTDSLLLDVNPDTNTALDLLVLTESDSGEGTLRVFTNDGGSPNAFSPGATVAVGTNPVQISSGNLDSETEVDLAVANRGPDGGDGSISILLGAGDGTLTAGPTLSASGNVTGVAIERFFGSGNDVAYTTIDSANAGFVNVYLKEAADDFAAEPISKALGDRAQNLVAFDSDSDSRAEAYMVNGIPGSGNSAMLIERGESITPDAGTGMVFDWNEFQLAYQTGLEPSRIVVSTLNGDDVEDLIITNSGSGSNGDSLSLFYGLGRHNYTNVDIFWTDAAPQLLVTQPWYISHTIGPNSIELEIDPRLFFDLTNDIPEGFTFDWMTATDDLERQINDPLLGEVREHFTSPVAVPFRVDVIDNEQTNPRVAISDTADYEDIIDWYVETS